MQFRADGPDIPIELIRAQERGECVFVCGAGISRGAGMPSFWGLVAAIYKDLGESWKLHPAEAQAMDDTHPMLDRALFALQLRLSANDRKRSAHVRRSMIDSVERQLQPRRGALPNHAALFRLSRDAELRSRIVTTNFDTLFERAARQVMKERLASYAVAELPPPNSPDFEGVLHLHGRTADKGLNLRRSDLVLNSADFGEAYLRSGWAARYVYDLARAASIVIVGYGADDPPVRYLLEVLSADRHRYPDLKPIYAFVRSDPGPEAVARQSALWVARGTLPIVYESATDAEHGTLYQSLRDWAAYADDPSTWQKATAAALFERSEESLTDREWELLRWSLTRRDGELLLAEVNPNPGWANALKARNLLGEEGAKPDRWIAKRLDDPAMIEAVVDGQLPITNSALFWLDFELERRENLPPLIQTAWRLILDSFRSTGRSHRDWFVTKRRISRGEVDISVHREVVRLLRPTPGSPTNTLLIQNAQASSISGAVMRICGNQDGRDAMRWILPPLALAVAGRSVHVAAYPAATLSVWWPNDPRPRLGSKHRYALPTTRRKSGSSRSGARSLSVLLGSEMRHSLSL